MQCVWFRQRCFNYNYRALNQANLMNLFKIVENLISSQIDADEEGFKVSNCRLKNLDWKKWWRKSFRGYNLFFLLCPENLDRFGENLNLIHQKTKRLSFFRKRSSFGTDQNVFSQTKFGLNRLRRHLMNWSNWVGKASGYAIQNYADLKLIVLTWCSFWRWIKWRICGVV